MLLSRIFLTQTQKNFALETEDISNFVKDMRLQWMFPGLFQGVVHIMYMSFLFFVFFQLNVTFFLVCFALSRSIYRLQLHYCSASVSNLVFLTHVILNLPWVKLNLTLPLSAFRPKTQVSIFQTFSALFASFTRLK